MKDHTSRRDYLIMIGGTSLVATSGCLRLTGQEQQISAAEAEGETQTETPTRTEASTQTQTPTGTETSTQAQTSTRTETSTQTQTPTRTSARQSGSSSGWDEKQTQGDASVSINSPTSVNYRVFKCGKAYTERQYSSQSGGITVSFEYEIEAEQWFEVPYLKLMQDGETVYKMPDISRDYEDYPYNIQPYDTTSGSFRETISVTGPFTLRLGIHPSNYCSAGDHGNTYFRVKEFTVQ